VLVTGTLEAIDEASSGPLCRRASKTTNSSQDTLFSTRALARKSATARWVRVSTTMSFGAPGAKAVPVDKNGVATAVPAASP